MEGHAFHKAVLGSLYHLKAATLQSIIKVDRGGLTADERDGLGFLRLIFVDGLLRHGVSAGEQALHGNVAILVRGNGLVKVLFAFDDKGDARNHAILGSLFQGNRASGRLHIQVCPHSVGIFHARDYILQVRVAIGDHLCAAADGRHIAPCGSNAYRPVKGGFRCDDELIAGLRHAYLAVRRSEGILGQHTVIVGQGQRVFPVLIGKLFCDVICTARHKTRYGVVPAHQGHNLVVDLNSTAVRVIRAKVDIINLLACLLIGAGGLPASRHKLPDKSLRRKPFFIVAAGKAAPVALIPIEQGKPHRFFLVGGEGVPSL